jgi:hypothetical protein
MTVLAALGTALLPVLAVIGLLALAAWRDHRRRAVVSRQARLSEALADQLGLLLAPVVSRRPGGGWRVDVAVPLCCRVSVGALLATVERVLPGRSDMVLRLREPTVTPVGRRHPAARPAAPGPAAGRSGRAGGPTPWTVAGAPDEIGGTGPCRGTAGRPTRALPGATRPPAVLPLAAGARAAERTRPRVPTR